MKKYSMTCTCGDTVSVDAESREDAVSKMTAMMTPEAVAQHYAEKHAGQEVPSAEQEVAMIEETVQEVSEEAPAEEQPVA
jgi:hypothetical protein